MCVAQSEIVEPASPRRVALNVEGLPVSHTDTDSLVTRGAQSESRQSCCVKKIGTSEVTLQANLGRAVFGQRRGEDRTRTTPENTRETALSSGSGAECGALPALSAIDDPDLRAVIEAWPGLGPDAQRAILRAAGIG